MSIELVLIDVDGCLTSGKGENINLFDIQRIKLKRTPIAICTGRSQPYVEALLQMLGLCSSEVPSIIENGCFLYVPKEDKVITTSSTKVVEEKFRHLRGYILRKIVDLGFADLEPGKELCISLNPIGISIEELRGMVEKLIMDKGFDLVACVSNSKSAVDITPLNIDKGLGVWHLVNMIEIDPDNILGIGDSCGDISMLEKVGVCACPGNATEDVKDLVKSRNGYVSDVHFTKGVLDILDHFKL